MRDDDPRVGQERSRVFYERARVCYERGDLRMARLFQDRARQWWMFGRQCYLDSQSTGWACDVPRKVMETLKQ
jgi:hypothetical protein